MQKQVIIIRTDLGMSPGKMVAQAGHAALRTPGIQSYDNPNDHVCVVCRVSSEAKLIALAARAEGAGLPYGLQRDAGKTEVEEGTYTALSIGPVDGDEDLEVLNAITKRLQTLTAKQGEDH